MDPLLTIAMPIYKKPLHMVREAVESILADDAPFRLLLVSDACTVYDGLPDIKDPRIVRFSMEENKGTFYIQAMSLAVCETEWWSAHDSDDLSRPGRFTKLLNLAKDFEGGACSDSIIQFLNGRIVHYPAKPVPKGHAKRTWIMHLPAHVVRTKALRRVGIPADMRAGADSAITPLLWHLFDVGVIHEPLYIVRKTPNSLTTSIHTGMGTPFRDRVKGMQLQRFTQAIQLNTPLPGYDKVDPADCRRLAAALR